MEGFGGWYSAPALHAMAGDDHDMPLLDQPFLLERQGSEDENESSTLVRRRSVVPQMQHLEFDASRTLRHMRG